MGALLRTIGLLSRGHVVERSRAELVSSYVADTSKNVKKAVQEALGGVLFIDEAYSLVNSESKNDTGRQAVDTLLQEVENRRSEFVLVMAGYTDEMAQFIATNPGLQSRITHYVDFEAYSMNELMSIADDMAKSRTRLEGPIRSKFSAALERGQQQLGRNFGNARTVRQLVNGSILLAQADRISTRERDVLLQRSSSSSTTTITLTEKHINDASTTLGFGIEKSNTSQKREAELQELLEKNNLLDCRQQLVEHLITGEIAFNDLTESDVAELGIKLVGNRRRLWRAILEWRKKGKK